MWINMFWSVRNLQMWLVWSALLALLQHIHVPLALTDVRKLIQTCTSIWKFQFEKNGNQWNLNKLFSIYQNRKINSNFKTIQNNSTLNVKKKTRTHLELVALEAADLAGLCVVGGWHGLCGALNLLFWEAKRRERGAICFGLVVVGVGAGPFLGAGRAGSQWFGRSLFKACQNN